MRDIIFRGKNKSGMVHTGNLYSDDKTYIIVNDSAYDIVSFIEVDPDSVGQMTDIDDVDGNPIFEGDLVFQRAVLVEDNLQFSGTVIFSEGQWLIDNGEEAIPLWTEHRENKIIGGN